MIEYRKLEKEDSKYIKEINDLYKQLSSHHEEIEAEKVRAIFDKENVFVLGAFDEGKLVGIASLHIVEMFAVTKSLIEEVVVDENYRRQGIARGLMEHLLEEGKNRKLKCAELTSNPKRVAANNLYQSLGFEQRETNVYRMNL